MGRESSTPLSLLDASSPDNSPPFVSRGVVDGVLALRSSRRHQYIPPPATVLPNLIVEVVGLARILTGANGSAIAFRKEQGTICLARSGEGSPPLGARVDITSGICKQCLLLGAALFCEDVAIVEPEIARTAGIRAVAVAPIYRDKEISGILAVFSSVPRVFTKLHLLWLQQMADWIGSAQSIRAEKPIPGRVADSTRRLDVLHDVLIETRLPWKRFIESVFLHVVVIGTLSGLSTIWPQVLPISLQPLRDVHVTYYPFSQSFSAYESSPPVRSPRRHTAVRQESPEAHLGSAPRRTSVSHDAVEARNIDERSIPVPDMPLFATRRFEKPAINAAVLPAPDIPDAKSHRLQVSKTSVIAPPPELNGASKLRTISGPTAAVVQPSPDFGDLGTGPARGFQGQSGVGSGLGNTFIVPPAPSLDGGARIANGVAAVAPGAHVIAAPPTVQLGFTSSGIGRGVSVAGGVPQVVAPPPSLTGNSLGAGRGDSLATSRGGTQIVPPPPSMLDGASIGDARWNGSLDRGTSEVVPPPSSVPDSSAGNAGTVGRGGSLAGAPGAAALAPEGNADLPGVDNARPAKPSTLARDDLDLSHRVFQDMQLRVIGLAWAPPRSSYFSNFEVFIAEKRVNKTESQFIKLVYVFLPYQMRLSQYGTDALRVRRIHVTRDSTCDENLMEMMWPEDENSISFSHSGDTVAPSSAKRNDLLPCYITTADDYVRAIAGSDSAKR